MKTFDFYLYTKVTTWYRTDFEIESDSLEDAKEKAIQFIKDDEQSSISWEQVDETIEVMSVEENNGKSTEELFYENDELIWDNTKK
jgi:catabolite regulation protein CreA